MDDEQLEAIREAQCKQALDDLAGHINQLENGAEIEAYLVGSIVASLGVMARLFGEDKAVFLAQRFSDQPLIPDDEELEVFHFQSGQVN